LGCGPVTYLEEAAQAIRARIPASSLPEDPNIDALFLIYAVLLFAKGEDVLNRDVHDAWVAWEVMNGRGEHGAVRPYAELPPETRQEDSVFVLAIREAARALN
jgi:hypothetical protein